MRGKNPKDGNFESHGPLRRVADLSTNPARSGVSRGAVTITSDWDVVEPENFSGNAPRPESFIPGLLTDPASGQPIYINVNNFNEPIYQNADQEFGPIYENTQWRQHANTVVRYAQSVLDDRVNNEILDEAIIEDLYVNAVVSANQGATSMMSEEEIAVAMYPDSEYSLERLHGRILGEQLVKYCNDRGITVFSTDFDETLSDHHTVRSRGGVPDAYYMNPNNRDSRDPMPDRLREWFQSGRGQHRIGMLEGMMRPRDPNALPMRIAIVSRQVVPNIKRALYGSTLPLDLIPDITILSAGMERKGNTKLWKVWKDEVLNQWADSQPSSDVFKVLHFDDSNDEGLVFQDPKNSHVAFVNIKKGKLPEAIEEIVQEKNLALQRDVDSMNARFGGVDISGIDNIEHVDISSLTDRQRKAFASKKRNDFSRASMALQRDIGARVEQLVASESVAKDGSSSAGALVKIKGLLGSAREKIARKFHIRNPFGRSKLSEEERMLKEVEKLRLADEDRRNAPGREGEEVNLASGAHGACGGSSAGGRFARSADCLVMKEGDFIEKDLLKTNAGRARLREELSSIANARFDGVNEVYRDGVLGSEKGIKVRDIIGRPVRKNHLEIADGAEAHMRIATTRAGTTGNIGALLLEVVESFSQGDYNSISAGASSLGIGVLSDKAIGYAGRKIATNFGKDVASLAGTNIPVVGGVVSNILMGIDLADTLRGDHPDIAHAAIDIVNIVLMDVGMALLASGNPIGEIAGSLVELASILLMIGEQIAKDIQYVDGVKKHQGLSASEVLELAFQHLVGKERPDIDAAEELFGHLTQRIKDSANYVTEEKFNAVVEVLGAVTKKTIEGVKDCNQGSKWENEEKYSKLVIDKIKSAVFLGKKKQHGAGDKVPVVHVSESGGSSLTSKGFLYNAECSGPPIVQSAGSKRPTGYQISPNPSNEALPDGIHGHCYSSNLDSLKHVRKSFEPEYDFQKTKIPKPCVSFRGINGEVSRGYKCNADALIPSEAPSLSSLKEFKDSSGSDELLTICENAYILSDSNGDLNPGSKVLAKLGTQSVAMISDVPNMDLTAILGGNEYNIVLHDADKATFILVEMPTGSVEVKGSGKPNVNVNLAFVSESFNTRIDSEGRLFLSSKRNDAKGEFAVRKVHSLVGANGGGGYVLIQIDGQVKKNTFPEMKLIDMSQFAATPPHQTTVPDTVEVSCRNSYHGMPTISAENYGIVLNSGDTLKVNCDVELKPTVFWGKNEISNNSALTTLDLSDVVDGHSKNIFLPDTSMEDIIEISTNERILSSVGGYSLKLKRDAKNTKTGETFEKVLEVKLGSKKATSFNIECSDGVLSLMVGKDGAVSIYAMHDPIAITSERPMDTINRMKDKINIRTLKWNYDNADGAYGIKSSAVFSDISYSAQDEKHDLGVVVGHNGDEIRSAFPDVKQLTYVVSDSSRDDVESGISALRIKPSNNFVNSLSKVSKGIGKELITQNIVVDFDFPNGKQTMSSLSLSMSELMMDINPSYKPFLASRLEGNDLVMSLSAKVPSNGDYGSMHVQPADSNNPSEGSIVTFTRVVVKDFMKCPTKRDGIVVYLGNGEFYRVKSALERQSKDASFTEVIRQERDMMQKKVVIGDLFGHSVVDAKTMIENGITGLQLTNAASVGDLCFFHVGNDLAILSQVDDNVLHVLVKDFYSYNPPPFALATSYHNHHEEVLDPKELLEATSNVETLTSEEYLNKFDLNVQLFDVPDSAPKVIHIQGKELKKSSKDAKKMRRTSDDSIDFNGKSVRIINVSKIYNPNDKIYVRGSNDGSGYFIVNPIFNGAGEIISYDRKVVIESDPLAKTLIKLNNNPGATFELGPTPITLTQSARSAVASANGKNFIVPSKVASLEIRDSDAVYNSVLNVGVDVKEKDVSLSQAYSDNAILSTMLDDIVVADGNNPSYKIYDQVKQDSPSSSLSALTIGGVVGGLGVLSVATALGYRAYKAIRRNGQMNGADAIEMQPFGPVAAAGVGMLGAADAQVRRAYGGHGDVRGATLGLFGSVATSLLSTTEASINHISDVVKSDVNRAKDYIASATNSVNSFFNGDVQPNNIASGHDVKNLVLYGGKPLLVDANVVIGATHNLPECSLPRGAALNKVYIPSEHDDLGSRRKPPVMMGQWKDDGIAQAVFSKPIGQGDAVRTTTRFDVKTGDLKSVHKGIIKDDSGKDNPRSLEQDDLTRARIKKLQEEGESFTVTNSDENPCRYEKDNNYSLGKKSDPRSAYQRGEIVRLLPDGSLIRESDIHKVSYSGKDDLGGLCYSPNAELPSGSDGSFVRASVQNFIPNSCATNDNPLCGVPGPLMHCDVNGLGVDNVHFVKDGFEGKKVFDNATYGKTAVAMKAEFIPSTTHVAKEVAVSAISGFGIGAVKELFHRSGIAEEMELRSRAKDLGLDFNADIKKLRKKVLKQEKRHSDFCNKAADLLKGEESFGPSSYEDVSVDAENLGLCSNPYPVLTDDINNLGNMVINAVGAGPFSYTFRKGVDVVGNKLHEMVDDALPLRGNSNNSAFLERAKGKIRGVAHSAISVGSAILPMATEFVASPILSTGKIISHSIGSKLGARATGEVIDRLRGNDRRPNRFSASSGPSML